MSAKKKQVLIVQPSFHVYRNRSLIKRRAKTCLAPSLVSPYLASFFPVRECEVRIVDEVVSDIRSDKRYDLVAVPFATGQAYRAYELADRFRSTGSKVVLGGYHVSACPDEAARHADAVVIGEFEPCADRFIGDFLGGTLQARYASAERFEMKAMRFPRFDLVDWSKYSTPTFTKIPMETSRGCPNACTFCCVRVVHGNRVRFRPVDEVLEHVDRVRRDFARLHPRFFFVDENMVAFSERNTRLLEAFIPRKMQWSTFFSTDICNHPEFVELAARSGCVGAVVGFETTNRQSLENVGKWGNRVQDYHKVAALFRRNNIPVYATIMAGFPNDTRETLRETVSFLKAAKIPFSFFYPVYPFPGTAMFDTLTREGLLVKEAFWRDIHNMYDLIRIEAFHDTPDDFEREFRKMVRDYYSLPSIAGRSFGSSHALRILVESVGLRLLHERYDSYATV
ncbi:MAG: B12-binding domain-containing radical SAM protein [Chitinispirillaceae bacterium]|nr:B12-binding domain-containing radical SAM protein [Chitinispirillaceae bacterium]